MKTKPETTGGRWKQSQVGPEASTDAWSNLCIRLQISRRVLSNCRKLSGAPEVPAFEAWQKFVEMTEPANIGAKPSKERDALQKEKLLSEIRLNELKIQKEEGKTILVTDVEERDRHLTACQRTYLGQKLGKELGMRCAGKSAEELCVLGGQIADEICEVFSAGVETWEESPRATPALEIAPARITQS